MRPAPDNAAASPRPVIYAGRFADEVPATKLPENCQVLGDRDVRPFQLAEALDGATALVVLDLFSFPFESMTGERRDVPLIAVLPPGFDAAFLDTVFGRPVLANIGPFDRVATADPNTWEDLRREYRWTDGQRIDLDGADLVETARICAGLAGEAAGFTPDKAVYRVQARALRPQFAAARGVRAGDVPFDVLEVGIESARWASDLDPAATRFAGLGLARDRIKTLYAGSPGARLDLVGAGFAFPYEDEGFDLAFGVSVLHHQPQNSRRAIVSEMWRVARPGGRLVFLEDFVAGEGVDGPAHVVSVQGFVELVLEATAGRVVLEHFEALRYPRDPFFRGGLLALSKVGTPRAW